MSEIRISVPFYPDDYIFMPACCYNGNRFLSLPKKYPPMFTPEEASVDMPTVITDVPRLQEDGSGKIEVTSGDAAVPCIGVYSPTRWKGWLLFTIQEINGRNIGLAYENGEMILTWPARRERIYTGFAMHDNPEPYVPAEAEIPHKLLQFSCNSMEQFYEIFFRNRKIMGMDDTMPEVLSHEEQFAVQREKYNTMNWRENGEFYGVGTIDSSRFQVWQPGWVGGAMATYAFLKLGGPLEKERSLKTLRHLFRLQGQSGLFYGGCDKDLTPFSDGFETPGTENWTLIRKSADCLFFVLRQFELLDAVPADLEENIRRCADAFVKMWRKYGQLGQFADAETGEIAAGGSASGGIASAGLVLAYRYFGDPAYLEAAEALGTYYYHAYVQKGYTTGGPGEILQCPDSESAFGLLESYVWLYDETGNNTYLRYAETTAHLCSSWVVSYNYHFPETSEFGRLGMKTIGSVFANVQNKHSAPGICTLSGTSLRKLYEWTGDKAYLDLFREITETISQYMSTENRPICSTAGQKLPAGFICERVNMSDWETQKWVGGVFNGSCWCEVSNLLVLSDM